MSRNTGEFTKEWETALIQPICEGKGNRKELGNCRGISLVPVQGKIYSGIIVYID
jgi:hypothetical protein